VHFVEWQTPCQDSRLDELINNGVVPPPDHIKVDIEGAEALALSGAELMLTKSSPIIFLATHGFTAHRDCCQLLQSLGYQLQSIDERHLSESNESLAT
jgi:Methyltransferase FkbM domain